MVAVAGRARVAHATRASRDKRLTSTTQQKERIRHTLAIHDTRAVVRGSHPEVMSDCAKGDIAPSASILWRTKIAILDDGTETRHRSFSRDPLCTEEDEVRQRFAILLMRQKRQHSPRLIGITGLRWRSGCLWLRRRARVAVVMWP